jgi:hypothetical protein
MGEDFQMKNAAIIEMDRENSNSAKKQSSRRRIAASRANGAKSHGPVTAEGKARSSRNAIKHSILADRATLSEEEKEEFQQMYEAYAARFQPRDSVESDLVEEFAFCKFQMRAAWVVEACTIETQMAENEPVLEEEKWTGLNADHHKAFAIQASLAKGNTIALMQRYVRSLSSQANRALKTLLDLQKLPLPTVDDPVEQEKRNKPSPISEHPELTPSTYNEPA